jgi:hypothetical protein
LSTRKVLQITTDRRAVVGAVIQSTVGGLTAPKCLLPIRPHRGNPVPRQNYRQVTKEKGLSRRAHRFEKQQCRTARPNGSGQIVTPMHDPPVDPSGSALAGGI